MDRFICDIEKKNQIPFSTNKTYLQVIVKFGCDFELIVHFQSVLFLIKTGKLFISLIKTKSGSGYREAVMAKQAWQCVGTTHRYLLSRLQKREKKKIRLR